MNGTVTIWGTTQFEAFHRWPDAPDACAFLRHLHRHMFHVRWEVPGSADPQYIDRRVVEFILKSQEVRLACIAQANLPTTESWSCEHWARWIGEEFNFTRVEVSEDGENGATWTRE